MAILRIDYKLYAGLIVRYTQNYLLGICRINYWTYSELTDKSHDAMLSFGCEIQTARDRKALDNEFLVREKLCLGRAKAPHCVLRGKMAVGLLCSLELFVQF